MPTGGGKTPAGSSCKTTDSSMTLEGSSSISTGNNRRAGCCSMHTSTRRTQASCSSHPGAFERERSRGRCRSGAAEKSPGSSTSSIQGPQGRRSEACAQCRQQLRQPPPQLLAGGDSMYTCSSRAQEGGSGMPKRHSMTLAGSSSKPTGSSRQQAGSGSMHTSTSRAQASGSRRRGEGERSRGWCRSGAAEKSPD